MNQDLAQREPWIGPPVPVLPIGADDTLLDLLARDLEPLATDHRFHPPIYFYDHHIRHFEARRAADEKARERGEAARVRAIEQHRLAKLAREEMLAALVESRRSTQAGWIAMLAAAAARVRGTPYEGTLLPDLERDMKTIAGWSLDEDFPARLDKERFEAAFERRLAECKT
jgi:hypothetical protein